MAWVAEVLPERQLQLWLRFQNPDKRHSIVVARRVERALGHEATPAILAAALLHDVGKIESRLHTYGRVVATLSGAFAGKGAGAIWMDGKGFARRVGLYLEHARIGGDLLELADADPLTVTWAREHHLPVEQWTLSETVGHVLRDADDD